MRTRVLVVGAGPAGLTVACELARRGVPYRIVERKHDPQQGSRGKGIQPRTLEVLDDLGVIDDVLGSGSYYPSFRVHLGSVWIPLPAWLFSSRKTPTPDVPYPNLWMLPQWRTEQILRDKLASMTGGGVEFGVRLKGLEVRGDEGVRVTLDKGGKGEESLTVDYVVAADGGHSTVRKLLGVSLVGEALPGQPAGLIADLNIAGLDHSVWHAWPLAKGCAMNLCPLPTSATLFQMMAILWQDTKPPELTEAGIRAFVDQALGPGRLDVVKVGWVSHYTPRAGLASAYCVGQRVFLAGDAAHVHPANGGQGLNTSVQDAYNLAWKLSEVLSGAPVALLDTYERERRAIAESMIAMSKRLMSTTHRGRETTQLDLCYPDSPLSVDLRVREAKGLLRAGDRAPDAPCVGVVGPAGRLFDLFRGPHFTVLAFDHFPPALPQILHKYGEHKVRFVCLSRKAGGAGTVLDASGAAHSLYDAQAGSIVVVRPDGYVGYLADALDASLDKYLAQTIGVTSISKL